MLFRHRRPSYSRGVYTLPLTSTAGERIAVAVNSQGAGVCWATLDEAIPENRYHAALQAALDILEPEPCRPTLRLL